MAILTFCGENFTVDHAVKGTNFIHGYDASGYCVVAFDNVEDLDAITYDGEYMAPEDCVAEGCNDVKQCSGYLVKRNGDRVTDLRLDGMLFVNPDIAGATLPEPGHKTRIFFLEVT